MSAQASTFDLLRWPYESKDEERRLVVSAPQKTQSHRDYSSIRNHQRASRIYFGEAPIAQPAKHLQESVEEDLPPRPQSAAKARELVGSNIFGKSAPKHYGRPATPEGKRKLQRKGIEMTGNEIFNYSVPHEEEKPFVNPVKLKEIEGHDIFSSEMQKPRYRLDGPLPTAVAAKMKDIRGTNPAYPDVKASLHLMENPKKMSDRHVSFTKIREISGNYDLWHGQDCLDFGKAPLGFPPIGPHLGKRQELLGTDPFPPTTRYTTHRILVQKPSGRAHVKLKLREIYGNYDLLSNAPNRSDLAGYIKCTPEKPVSLAKRREMVGNQIFGKA